MAITEDKLLPIYTAIKGWRMRKLKTTQHMIEKLGISFDISSYNETQKVMLVLEKPIQQMRDVYGWSNKPPPLARKMPSRFF